MRSKFTRKEFLLSPVALYGTGVGWLVLSCGGDDDDDSNDQNGADDDVDDDDDAVDGEVDSGADVGSCAAEVEFVNGHLHMVAVPAADVEAGEEITYTLSEASGHTHTVTLDANDLATLENDGNLSIESSTDAGHSHAVIVTCA